MIPAVERSVNVLEKQQYSSILKYFQTNSLKENFKGFLKCSRHYQNLLNEKSFLLQLLKILDPLTLPRLLSCEDPAFQQIALSILYRFITILSHVDKKLEACVPYVAKLIEKTPVNHFVSPHDAAAQFSGAIEACHEWKLLQEIQTVQSKESASTVSSPFYLLSNNVCETAVQCLLCFAAKLGSERVCGIPYCPIENEMDEFSEAMHSFYSQMDKSLDTDKEEEEEEDFMLGSPSAEDASEREFTPLKETGYELHKQWLREQDELTGESQQSIPRVASKEGSIENDEVDASDSEGSEGDREADTSYNSSIPLVLLIKLEALSISKEVDGSLCTVLLQCLDVFFSELCNRDAIMWRYGKVLSSLAILDSSDEWIFKSIQNLVVCFDEDKGFSMLPECLSLFKHHCLQDLTKRLTFILKNRLSAEHRRFVLQLVGLIVHHYGLEWISCESVDLLRLSIKLCAVELQIHLFDVSESERSEAEEKNNSRITILGVVYKVIEAIMYALHRDSDQLEENPILLKHMYGIFEGLHNCIDCILEFIKDNKENAQNKRLELAACARLLGRWMTVEPLKYEHEFLSVIPILVKALEFHQLLFIFQALENCIVSDWYDIEGIIDALQMGLVSFPPNVEEANDFLQYHSCVLSLIVAALMDPMVDFYSKSTLYFSYSGARNEYLDKISEKPALYDVTAFPDRYIHHPTSALPTPAHTIANIDVITASCLNAAYGFHRMHSFAVYFTQEPIVPIEKYLHMKSVNEIHYLWECGLVCAVSALIGIQIDQSVLTTILKVQEIVCIWDFLIARFLSLTPSSSIEYLCVATPSVSMWYRMARVVAICMQSHSYLLSVFYQRINRLKKTRKAIFPPPPTVPSSSLSTEDAFDAADEEIIRYFHSLVS